MGEALAELIPLGIAVAASPFPVIPAVLLLFTARARVTAGGFLAGWVVGIAVSTVAFVVLSSVIESAYGTPTWAAWARVVGGAALLVLGARQWANRRARTELPAWMESIDRLTPLTALRLGLLLSAANPKVLLLAAAAGVVVGSAELTGTQAAAATLLFTLLASSTVALPLVLHALLGDRVLGPLGAARAWLQANNAAVMAVVITVIGAALLAKGLTAL